MTVFSSASSKPASGRKVADAGPRRADRASHLKTRSLDLLKALASDSDPVAGWLAVETAEALLTEARERFGPGLTLDQQGELEELIVRLRVLLAGL